jgi:hypothetical protein
VQFSIETPIVAVPALRELKILHCFQRPYIFFIIIQLGTVVRGRGEVHTGFWWGDLREGDHLGDPGIDKKKIKAVPLQAWTGPQGSRRSRLPDS